MADKKAKAVESEINACSDIDPPTAGLLIIGDEILKGHTKDTNSYFLLGRLWSLGIKVKAVSVISDDVDEIAQYVRDFSSKFTYVLTSGGIGPTHDDVTLMAVAKAFGEPLVHNKKLADTISYLYGIKHLNSFLLKMAQVPSSSKIHYDTSNEDEKRSPFPLVAVHNVYIYPGVPILLQKLFDSFSHLFSSTGRHFFLERIYLSVEESTVAGQLHEVHELYGDKVNLGSYPEINCAEFQTKLILESLFPDILADAVQHILRILPSKAVVKKEAHMSGQDLSVMKKGMIYLGCSLL